jgi:flagellar basal body-associated protein FliL
MHGRGTAEGLDKRKVCVFLILVAVALLCVCVIAYVLFYAKPHGNPEIQNAPQSTLRQPAPLIPDRSVSIPEQRNGRSEHA